MSRAAQMLLLAGAAALSPTGARAAANDLYACGHLGFTTQALGDVNGAIDKQERIFRTAGVPVDFHDFGGAPVFAGEVGLRVTPALSLAVGLDYQSDRVTNSYTNVNGSYSDRIDLRLVEIAGVVTYWLPTVLGAYCGAQLGMGFGRMREKTHFRDFNNPFNDQDISSDFNGSGVTFGVFGGYEQPVATNVSAGVRAGYRRLNLGVFDGTASSPQVAGTYRGPPTDSSGQEIESDWSGVFVAASFDVLFGGR